MVDVVDEQFSVHEDPVWRDRADFIVNAPLAEDGRFEQLWCRRLSDDTFEVCCIPFFLYDVALGDTVRTEATKSRTYLVSKVLVASGRYVFRVHFDRSMLRHRDEVVAELMAMGALVEWSSPSMFAVDAVDADHAQRVADVLFAHEQAGRLVYETGRSA